MISGEGDGDGPGPVDEEGRKLLFGLPKEDEGAEAEPKSPPRRPAGVSAAASPGTPPPGKDGSGSRSAGADGSSADPGSTLDALAAGQRRLEAMLLEIREAGIALAELGRTIGQATEWVNSVKEANDAHLQAAGALIKALKDGRGDLHRVSAALNSQKEALEKQQGTLDKGIGELRTLWKSVNERLEELATTIRELVNAYRDWTDQAAAHRTEMAGMAKLLRNSNADMKQSVTKIEEAQRDISTRIFGNVQNVKNENDRFLERFDEDGKELLGTIRREWTDTRRWTVPAMAAALVVAVLSFPMLGAWAQSELGVFDAYDDTKGWKQLVWDRHGERIESCMRASRQAGKVVGCRLRVDGRGFDDGRADRLPPLPGRG